MNPTIMAKFEYSPCASCNAIQTWSRNDLSETLEGGIEQKWDFTMHFSFPFPTPTRYEALIDTVPPNRTEVYLNIVSVVYE